MTRPAPKAEPDDKDLTIAYMAGYHKGKTDAQPKAEPVAWSDEHLKMLNFLAGAGDFNGVWFGEQHPTEKGSFWWRAHLRRLFTHTAPKAEPVVWECIAGGLRKLTQKQYEAQTEAVKRHYTRIPESVNQQLLDALEESNSLIAAMMHEERPLPEIVDQMVNNRAALIAAKQAQGAKTW